MTAVLQRLRITEGQGYTLVIGLVLATVLAVTGIPAVLRTRTLPAAASNALHPRADALAGAASSSASTPATSAAVPTPAIGALRKKSPFTAIGGATASPAGPPAINGVAVAPPAPLTITTFAHVDHPGAPGGLAVASDGTVYVTTNNGTARGDRGPSHVFSYDGKGHQTTDRTIEGQPDDHVNGLAGAAVDPLTGEVAVLEPDQARIVGIDPASGAQRVIADVPDLPACLISLGAATCQQGAEDRKPFPLAAAFDKNGDLFVSDPTQDTIWRLAHGKGVLDRWYQSSFFATGDGPYGLAVDEGAVEFTVGTTLDPAAPTSGGLYRVAVNADGTAGALALVAAFPRGDEPGPLAVGSSGTAYVVLRASGAIVAIAPTGSESWRIAAPGTGPIPLDAPSALAMTAGQLLVANQGSGTDATHWAVLAVSVNDGARS